ncbi:hypothetical protein BJX76DRAFT_116599 [Aspergillus varians]
MHPGKGDCGFCVLVLRQGPPLSEGQKWFCLSSMLLLLLFLSGGPPVNYSFIRFSLSLFSCLVSRPWWISPVLGRPHSMILLIADPFFYSVGPGLSLFFSLSKAPKAPTPDIAPPVLQSSKDA